MNKPLIALLLITSFSASADKIPSSIQNLIAVYDTGTHSLEDGGLTIRYNKRLLLVDAAESMFQGICNDYYMNKWKPARSRELHFLMSLAIRALKSMLEGMSVEKLAQ